MLALSLCSLKSFFIKSSMFSGFIPLYLFLLYFHFSQYQITRKLLEKCLNIEKVQKTFFEEVRGGLGSEHAHCYGTFKKLVRNFEY